MNIIYVFWDIVLAAFGVHVFFWVGTAHSIQFSSVQFIQQHLINSVVLWHFTATTADQQICGPRGQTARGLAGKVQCS